MRVEIKKMDFLYGLKSIGINKTDKKKKNLKIKSI